MGGLMKMALEKIDYTQMSNRGLKDLINQDDDKALEEYCKRMDDGRVPVKTYRTLEELEQGILGKKAS